MKRKAKEELERSQKSVSYMPDDVLQNRTDVVNRAEYHTEFYPSMFIEDVRLRIMPIGGQVSKKEFNISLDPPDPRAQQIIEKAISRDRQRDNFARIICDFISNCAAHLLIYETETYEIVYLSEPESRKTVGFEFVQINPFTLVERGDSFSQFLPDQHSTKLKKRRRIELQPEHILTFRLPMNLRGKLDEITESIRILSVTSPDFFMKELEAGSRKTAYDFTRHHHLRNVALARITKDFGWDARNSFEKEATEYYLIHRYVKFERFKIGLRDSILDTLNAGLQLAGKQLGFNTKISSTGLPTLAGVGVAYDHLTKGDISFREILQSFQGF